MTPGRAFILGLWVVGALTALWLARGPQPNPVPMAYFTIPMVAGLAVELALRPLVNAGRVAPLGVGERAIGVLGAAIIAFIGSGLFRS